MTDVIPIRLQLSRASGFRLHQLSHAANGLPARRVDRATPFGNPFKFIQDQGMIVTTSDEETAENAAPLVASYRRWLVNTRAGRAIAERARTELRGHNLACWCGLASPCHADTLLKIANGG